MVKESNATINVITPLWLSSLLFSCSRNSSSSPQKGLHEQHQVTQYTVAPQLNHVQFGHLK